MLKLKIIENHCKNGNRTLLEAPMGNMEEITQFQYNLEKLGYVVSKLDANELIIESKETSLIINSFPKYLAISLAISTSTPTISPFS